jgi:hypothetical protein
MPMGSNLSEPTVLQGFLGACLIGPRHQFKDTDDEGDHTEYGFHAKSIHQIVEFLRPEA